MSTSRMTFVVLCVAGILHMAHFYSVNDGAYEIVAVEGINDYRNSLSLSLVGIELIFSSGRFARGLDVKKKKRRRGLY